MCNFQNELDEITFALHEIQELNDLDSDELEKKSWTIPVTCSLRAVEVGGVKLLHMEACMQMHWCTAAGRCQAESACLSSDTQI